MKVNGNSCQRIFTEMIGEYRKRIGREESEHCISRPVAKTEKNTG